MTLLLLIIAATATLLAIDAGCYFWLRATDARRALPIRHLTCRRRLQARSA
jgi:hypothetical protein